MQLWLTERLIMSGNLDIRSSLEKSRRDEVPSVFLSPADKNLCFMKRLFYEAFEKVGAFWGENGTTHEINS